MFNVRNKIIARAISHNRRKVIFPDLQNITSVAYVFAGEVQNHDLYWNKIGIPVNITSFSFINGKRGDDSRANVIYSSDLNFWKLPHKKHIHSFTETPFDLLINMAGNSNDALNYICATSKAKFKIAYTPFNSLYDLVISLDENNKHNLSSEVIKTLGNLKRME